MRAGLHAGCVPGALEGDVGEEIAAAALLGARSG